MPPKNNTTTFRRKLDTRHCQGMELLFDGADYVSYDVESSKIVPNGLDCSELEHQEMSGTARCPLCDSEEALRFLKAKGIVYEPDYQKVADDPHDAGAGGAAEDTKEKAKGKGVAGSERKSVDRPQGSSTDEGEVRHMAKKDKAVNARSGLAESTSASAGCD